MGDLMPGIPSIPGDETTWAAFVDQFETLKRGDMPLSLTNWDASSTVPAIAAGAGIEIAGATYRFTAESLILDEAGLVAGTVYVVIKTADPTANEATAYFTNVAPEWRDDLNGWYDATGANRYTGHVMDWDGAAAYTNKRMFTVDGPGGELVTVGAGGAVNIESDLHIDEITYTNWLYADPSGATGMNAKYAIKWTTFSGTLDGLGGWAGVPHDIPGLLPSTVGGIEYALYNGADLAYAPPPGAVVTVGPLNITVVTSSAYANYEIRGRIIFREYIG
ncbi:MAG: hypothetical protein DRI69_10415 [Bacteroidetes bacterium]|nr:MAG: hypothetical protein DRI69_10415 [Bacteroidota bacterium]